MPFYVRENEFTSPQHKHLRHIQSKLRSDYRLLGNFAESFLFTLSDSVQTIIKPINFSGSGFYHRTKLTPPVLLLYIFISSLSILWNSFQIKNALYAVVDFSSKLHMKISCFFLTTNILDISWSGLHGNPVDKQVEWIKADFSPMMALNIFLCFYSFSVQ